jgi:hypothetical protein
MGLFDALKEFVNAVNQEYDRRVKAASNVKDYDPTGAHHHGHDHVELQNEQVVAIEDTTGGNGYDSGVRQPEPTDLEAPRQVTHH